MKYPLQLISVQIGVCRPLMIQDRKVISGIHKQPISHSVAVTKVGLVGDEQADLSVHGGLSKAIYAYPCEHYPYWNQQALENGLETPLSYGYLGENLTLAGLLEKDVYVGDELHFANCILRITQPRQPCFKFNAVMNDSKAAKKMAQSGYSGFYLAVIKTGSLVAGEYFKLVSGDRSTSILSLFKASRLKTKND